MSNILVRVKWESFRRHLHSFKRNGVVNLNKSMLQIIYIIYDLLGGGRIVPPKKEKTKKVPKTQCLRDFWHAAGDSNPRPTGS